MLLPHRTFATVAKLKLGWRVTLSGTALDASCAKVQRKTETTKYYGKKCPIKRRPTLAPLMLRNSLNGKSGKFANCNWRISLSSSNSAVATAELTFDCSISSVTTDEFDSNCHHFPMCKFCTLDIFPAAEM